MDRMGYPKGLIRYATTHAIEERMSRSAMLRQFLRPRVLIYTGILAAVTVAAGIGLYLRVPLKVDVIRDRAAIAREVEGGRIENVYRLQIMNTAESERRFEMRVQGLPSVAIAGDASIVLEGATARMVPVKVRVEPAPSPSERIASSLRHAR
jgi:polyferredoxin